jgi:hypothetical protein
MLFDIEDYTTDNRFIEDTIGIWNPTAAQIFDVNGMYLTDPQDSAGTARATRDAFIKAFGEFYLLMSKAPIEKFELFEAKYNEFSAAYLELAPYWAAFWNAYGSFAFYGTGLVEGDITPEEEFPFIIMTQAIYDNYALCLKNMMTKVKEFMELAGDYTI